MFAGAAREAVFSNPNVVRRVNQEFIPVALKAGMINNPPRGIEGELYAEIARSKPAPDVVVSQHERVERNDEERRGDSRPGQPHESVRTGSR